MLPPQKYSDWSFYLPEIAYEAFLDLKTLWNPVDAWDKVAEAQDFYLPKLTASESEWIAMAEETLVAEMVKYLNPLEWSYATCYKKQIDWRGLCSFGSCNGIFLHYQNGILLRTEKQIRETVLHEIAHALLPREAAIAGQGHGDSWKKKCSELGLTSDYIKQY